MTSAGPGTCSAARRVAYDRDVARYSTYLIVIVALAVAAVPAAGAGLPAPLPPVPIPSLPGPATFEGAPASARPIPGVPATPRNPFMAPNGESEIHDDGWQTDTYTWGGPLGRSPVVCSNLLGADCGSIAFVIAEKGNGFEKVGDHDLTGVPTSAENITSALPDWRGLLWFVARDDGVVGTLNLATGLGYNNNYAGIALSRGGSEYLGTLGGIVSVRDSAQS
jgi:hypothetical protein